MVPSARAWIPPLSPMPHAILFLSPHKTRMILRAHPHPAWARHLGSGTVDGIKSQSVEGSPRAPVPRSQCWMMRLRGSANGINKSERLHSLEGRPHTTLHGGSGGAGGHAHLGALTFYSIYCLGFGNSLAMATHVRAVIGRPPEIIPQRQFGSPRDPAIHRPSHRGGRTAICGGAARCTKTVITVKTVPKTMRKLRKTAQKP